MEIDNLTYDINNLKIKSIDYDSGDCYCDLVYNNVEIDDIDCFIELARIYINKLNNIKYKFSKNNLKNLILFYEQIYQKILVYNKNINFNYTYVEYNDLSKDNINSIKKIQREIYPLLLDLKLCNLL